MRTFTAGLAAALLFGASASALAANTWGIKNERVATFEATVVDVLCELSGDCAENCGDGARQLGLLRDDGTLVLAAKGNTLFAGAIKDLLPHCGQTIEVDGLLIENPLMTMYFVQALRTRPEQEWQNAVQFQQDWSARYPDLPPPWWINDPTVAEELNRNGVLGIPGLEP